MRAKKVIEKLSADEKLEIFIYEEEFFCNTKAYPELFKAVSRFKISNRDEFLIAMQY